MSSIFKPLTVGYDWEMAVVKDTMESIGEEKIKKLANEIRNKLPWSKVGIDLDLLELRIGVIRSWDELIEKNQECFNTARKLARKKGWLILPIGARPINEMPIGSHIHVGSVYDLPGAVAVANRMMDYVPVFIALMANSPFSRFEGGDFKSIRIAHNAEWCSNPQPIYHPRYARLTWGEDTCVKAPWNSTVELRCCDSASSPRLMSECTILAAGVMYHLSHRTNFGVWKFNEEQFYWNSINRWRAAKYGLQAKLWWQDKEISVCEIAKTMIEAAQEGLSLMGTSLNDLKVINKMISKRQTQADFIMSLYAVEKDLHSLMRRIATIYEEDEEAFQAYLDTIPTLKPLKPENIEDFVLNRITRNTDYHKILLSTPLGPYDLDKLLDTLIAKGKIKSEDSSEEGRTLSRKTITG